MLKTAYPSAHIMKNVYCWDNVYLILHTNMPIIYLNNNKKDLAQKKER